MKMTMIFCVDVLSSHTEVSKWGHFEENWCFLIFYKGKFPVLKKYLLISFKWAGMSKNLFLILFCICVTIENWVMRQRTNVDKLVICNFCTQNHLKMAKICILRPKNATFVQSNHPGPLKHTFLTPPVCVLRPRKVKK